MKNNSSAKFFPTATKQSQITPISTPLKRGYSQTQNSHTSKKVFKPKKSKLTAF